MNRGTLLTLVATATFALVLAWQHQATRRLNAELAILRSALSPAAPRPDTQATPSREERERGLRRQEMERLEAEIRRLHAAVSARARLPVMATASQDRLRPSMLEGQVSVAEWRCKGLGAPADTLETALWAAAGGDLKALADTLYLDSQTRERARRLLESLPASSRSDLGSPEELLALLLSPDIPLGQAFLSPLKGAFPENYTEIAASLSDENHHSRTTILGLVQNTPGEWRILVPDEAFEKYEARLTLATQRSP